MINGSSDQLDRIEGLVEENRRDINRLERRVESNAKAIAANSTQIAKMRDSLSEAAGRTLRAVDELREVVEEDRINLREHLERTDTAIAGSTRPWLYCSSCCAIAMATATDHSLE